MDPVTALGLATGVVQLIQFATAIVSKTSEISRSASGILIENVDLVSTTEDLKMRADILKQSQDPADTDLARLSAECYDVAQELLNALEMVRVKGPLTKFKSLRKALRSEWSKDKIRGIESRLAIFREQMNLAICAQLRIQIEMLSADQLDGFQRLDQTSQLQVQQMLNALKYNEDVFALQLDTRVTKTELVIEHQHEMTRTEIISILDANHTNLTQELTDCQKNIKQLEDEIKRLHEDLKQIILATMTKSGTEREAFRDRGNKLTVVIISMENLAAELEVLLIELWQATKLLCDKFKLNFESVTSQLAQLTAPPRQFLLTSASLRRKPIDEAAADALQVYYARRYMHVVKVHRVSCRLSDVSQDRMISQCPETIRKLQGLTFLMGREQETMRFVKLMSTTVVLCDKFFPGRCFPVHSFTELTLLTMLRILLNSKYQPLYCERYRPFYCETDGPLLPNGVYDTISTLLVEDDPSKRFFSRLEGEGAYHLRPAPLGSLVNIGARFLQDIALWRQLGEATGLKSRADEARPTFFTDEQREIEEPRYVRRVLITMIVFLVAFVSCEGADFRVRNVPGNPSYIYTRPYFADLDRRRSPEIWELAKSLEFLGGPLYCWGD